VHGTVAFAGAHVLFDDLHTQDVELATMSVPA
jgi:hypothetical protein